MSYLWISLATTTSTTRTTLKPNITKCELRMLSAKSAFPSDFFSLEDRQSGAIVVHVLISIYIIIFSEHVFEKYFLPSVEYLCFERLKLTAHKAGFTILALGASVTELSLTTFGVTVGKNDIALYALIGSASYNMLMIASICCFCVYAFKVTIDSDTFLKHSAFYALNLLILIAMFYKNYNSHLHWHDSLFSIFIYVAFAYLSLNEHKIRRFLDTKTQKSSSFSSSPPLAAAAADDENTSGGGGENTTQPSLVEQKGSSSSFSDSYPNLMLANKYTLIDLVVADSKNNFNFYQTSTYVNDMYNEPYDVLQAYKEIKPLNLSKKFKLIAVLPARMLAYLLIVDFRRFQNAGRKNFFFPITLLTSFSILIACSFILIWMMTLICETFSLSIPIFGMVFLPSLLCVKETLAIQTISKRELKKLRDFRYQKEDSMAATIQPQTRETYQQYRLSFILSSFMSCNLFDMTVTIGFAYLVNSLLFGSGNNSDLSTNVYMGKNVSLILLGLLVSQGLFLATFALFRFRMSMYFGFVLMFIWILYMVFVFALEVEFLELNFLDFLKKFVC